MSTGTFLSVVGRPRTLLAAPSAIWMIVHYMVAEGRLSDADLEQLHFLRSRLACLPQSVHSARAAPGFSESVRLKLCSLASYDDALRRLVSRVPFTLGDLAPDKKDRASSQEPHIRDLSMKRGRWG